MPDSVVVKMIETVGREGDVVAAKMRIETMIRSSNKSRPPATSLLPLAAGVFVTGEG